MSSEGKLYRLPTVGVGTSATTTSSGPPPSKSTRQQQQFSDLNNNQIVQSVGGGSGSGTKSVTINAGSATTTTMTTKQQQQSQPQQRQPAQQRSNSTSTTTRRLEEVQVSLVINRPGVGAKNGGGGAESDMVAIDVEDEVKVPFKSPSDAASSSLPQSKSSASKDLNNLVRRSSEVVLDNAPVATTPEAILGIETPDAKVG